MKRITSLVGLTLLFACGGEGSGDSQSTPGAPRLRGRAFALDPLVNEPVRVFGFGPGADDPMIAESTTDVRGGFEIELPSSGGAFRVEAGVGALFPAVSAILSGPALEGDDLVELNPFTGFAAALASQRVRARGRPVARALAESAALIDAHFAGVEHHRVPPGEGLEGARPSPSGLSRWLVLGLVEQARAAGVSLAELLDVYTEDLAADGVFDGQGAAGRALLAGATRLSGDSLRGEYAAALERVLAGAGIQLDAYADLLTRVRSNTSEIFPPSVVIDPTTPDAGVTDGEENPGVDQEGPSLELGLLDVDGVFIAPGSAVRGVVRVRSLASDPAGVVSTQLDVEGSEGRRVPLFGEQLDTTHLGDGAFRLYLEAVDTHGNVSVSEVGYLADNTAPVVELVHAAVVGGSPASVRVRATDGDQVQRLSILANGVNAAALRDPAAESTVSVVLSCPGTTQLEATAFDRAGNSGVVKTAILCEDRGPLIGIVPAAWRQEGNVTATYRADGRTVDYTTLQPVYASFDDTLTDELVVERYWPRLHESLVGRDDLPRVRFQVEDRSQAGVVVEARHETAADPGVWFPAESIGDGLYEVPLGYEQLGVSLLEQHLSGQAIVLRATDAFGVVNERAVRFRLALRSPPLWVGSCSLMASAMDPAGMVARLQTLARTDLGSLAARYSAEVPAGSPLPPLTVAVGAVSAGARVELTGLSMVRFDGAFAARSGSSGPGYLDCRWVSAGIGSVYENYRCLGVQLDGTWTWLQTPRTGASRVGSLPPAEAQVAPRDPINQVSPAPVGLDFSSAAPPLPTGNGSSFELAMDVDLEAAVSMWPTPVRIGNQTWSWPSNPSLARSDLQPAAPLGAAYWLPNHQGEIGAHGRNLSCTPSQRVALGIGGTDVSPACTWQERAVQTLPRLTRVVVRAPVPTLSATLPELGLTVPVQLSSDCQSEWRYELDLTLL